MWVIELYLSILVLRLNIWRQLIAVIKMILLKATETFELPQSAAAGWLHGPETPKQQLLCGVKEGRRVLIIHFPFQFSATGLAVRLIYSCWKSAGVLHKCLAKVILKCSANVYGRKKNTTKTRLWGYFCTWNTQVNFPHLWHRLQRS